MTEEMNGEGAPQGLSWSWELDFDTLTAAIADAGLSEPGNSSAGSSGTGSSGTSSSSTGPASTEGSPGADAPGAGTPPAGSSRAGCSGAGSAPAGSSGDAARHADGAASAGAVPQADPGEPAAAGDDLDGLAPEQDDGARLPAGALAGVVAERLAPGPDLAAWLAMAPAATLSDGNLAAVAGSWRRVASWAQARELAAVAQIASRAAARDKDTGTGPDGRPARVPASAAAEVALELTMSQYGASWWTDLAVTLGWRLAATGAALDAGTIDLARARLIAEATAALSDQVAQAVQDRVLPAAGEQTTGMLRAALRRAVIAAGPRGAEDRRKEAERRAKVVLYPDEENTATLAGQRLPAVHAAAAMARIKAMARAMKASGAGGPVDLLCAQVYVGLLLGTLPLIPPADGAPPADPAAPPGGEPPHGPAGHGAGPGEPPRRAGDPGPPPSPPPPSPPPGNDAPRGQDPPAGEVPPPGDADAPRDEDDYSCPDGGHVPGGPEISGQDADDDGRPATNWPDLPAVIPPAFARPGAPAGGTGAGDGRDSSTPAGLLEVSLPWQVLAGISAGPGYLSRIGPVTATQARRLAERAAGDPGAEWRIIVTTPGGAALAVTRIPRPRARDGPQGPGTATSAAAGTGLVGRVTLTITEDLATHPPPPGRPRASPGHPGSNILALAIQAAARAATQARAAAAADAAAGGCAHAAASPGYRPPPRLQDYVTARDLTCRFPRCRQPAWRSDLDHTIPHDDGGLTCRCNLGALCRTHHLLKHHPDWKLEQHAPGIFTWTTPSGRTFTATPDTHLV